MRCKPNWHQCFNCGRGAAAFWHGDGVTVAVCCSCATAALPALIADAVRLDEREAHNGATHRLVEVEATYWRAMAIRLATERGESREHGGPDR
jgi:hypothetical protein